MKRKRTDGEDDDDKDAGIEDGAGVGPTLEDLPVEMIAHVCSYLSAYDAAKLTMANTLMASVAQAVGAARPSGEVPTSPTAGPLMGTYVNVYIDRRGRPTHRAWRPYHPSEALRMAARAWARRPLPLFSGAPQQLPFVVPHGAWTMLSPPPAERLAADLAMCYALAACGRMGARHPVLGHILSEPLPAGTVLVVREPGRAPDTSAVASYAEVFARIEPIEARRRRKGGGDRRARYHGWADHAESLYAGPKDVRVRRDGAAYTIEASFGDE
jgi:hypothetical protein